MHFRSTAAHSIPLVAPRFDTIQLSTGISMHYAEYGDATGDPIVFLHGFSDSWFSYSEVIKHLDPRHRMFLLDQRGHGNSSTAESYRMSDSAEDTAAFIRAKGLQEVTLVGHSMGSIIAQCTAVQFPDLIARLVLIGSAANTFPEELGGLLEAVNALEDPVPEAFARDFQMSTIYRPIPAEFLERAIAESTKLSARTWKLALADMLATTSALDQIQMPTLILWGDKDTVFSYGEQEKLVRAIPNAELLVYEEIGHALQWEDPQRFAHDLEVFIARTSNSSLASHHARVKDTLINGRLAE